MWGSFSPKIVEKKKNCQNPFQIQKKIEKSSYCHEAEGRGVKAFVALPLKKDFFCGFPKIDPKSGLTTELSIMFSRFRDIVLNALDLHDQFNG